jgi:hypothetical protein
VSCYLQHWRHQRLLPQQLLLVAAASPAGEAISQLGRCWGSFLGLCFKFCITRSCCYGRHRRWVSMQRVLVLGSVFMSGIRVGAIERLPSTLVSYRCESSSARSCVMFQIMK